MFCLKCGMQMPDSATKCPQCGGALNLPEPPVQPVVAPGAQPEEAARMLHLNSLFTLFRSGMVKALMVWEIAGAVLFVLLCLLSIRALFSNSFLTLLMLAVLVFAVAKVFIALGLRTVHNATFADEARRGCRQVRVGLYLTMAATLFALLSLLLTARLFGTVRSEVEGVYVYQMTTVTSGWGTVWLVVSAVIGCAPYLLEAEMLRRCSYNLWVLSDPTVSRQHIQVGGLVTAIVVAVSAVINLFSGELVATGTFSLSSLVPLVAQVIVALIAFEFYKISKAARVAPEDTAE